MELFTDKKTASEKFILRIVILVIIIKSVKKIPLTL